MSVSGLLHRALLVSCARTLHLTWLNQRLLMAAGVWDDHHTPSGRAPAVQLLPECADAGDVSIFTEVCALEYNCNA